jgi:hypothetical protein
MVDALRRNLSRCALNGVRRQGDAGTGRDAACFHLVAGDPTKIRFIACGSAYRNFRSLGTASTLVSEGPLGYTRKRGILTGSLLTTALLTTNAGHSRETPPRKALGWFVGGRLCFISTLRLPSGHAPLGLFQGQREIRREFKQGSWRV